MKKLLTIALLGTALTGVSGVAHAATEGGVDSANTPVTVTLRRSLASSVSVEDQDSGWQKLALADGVRVDISKDGGVVTRTGSAVITAGDSVSVVLAP